ncbi:MAG: tRNA pseudouridine(38-40) synthase TruA [Tissierellia bacterium]|jgi:tRNA pseudouridine38-40 synthase|nr:tRNA pseudouridine(38-40) synthase TruA [Tissierellia bacterium]
MKNIKLTIEYDGTNYHGWQNQRDVNSIQEEIEKALTKVLGKYVDIIGSGRTDAGAHAKGQVANFYTNSKLPAERFKYALNMRLPRDITIVNSEEVGLDFHSRFSAKRKQYKYIIWNNEMPSAINRNYSYHIINKLNIDEMKQACQYLIGTHDFRSFMTKGTIVKDTIRTIYSIDIIKKDSFVELTLVGSSFLRSMIRIIVGTLILVGNGKLRKEDLPHIISGKKRCLSGPTAPAQGLYLQKVYY